MPKVIFLDVDDISNSDRLITSCRDFDDQIAPPVRIARRGDPVVMALINKACEVTGAKVVVSSTWIEAIGWTYTRDWLVGGGLDEQHFHPHSCIAFGPGGGKPDGIGDWLKQHPETTADHTCIVDDDPDLFPRGHILRERQVIVRGPNGLLLEHFHSIIQKLGKAA